MNCSNCGAANPADQHFCDACGVALAIGCPACDQPNRPGARFCGNCGTTLGAARTDASAAASGPAAAAASAPAVPASHNLAERRLVSILFADLVNFTPLAERHDAEDVRDLLARYYDAARATIERHGGTVEKFIGDAVMAVWGTPVAHEDDAERAVRAALELISSVHGLSAGMEARAAVLSGEAAVTVGAVEQAMVAGDLVNTAARLQAAAAPGAVLVGEATMRAAAATVEFELAGEHELKGKSAPVAAWRVLRVTAEVGGRSRSDALEPLFVGREGELSLLKELLHASALERRPRLVTVTGPAGIGKSRLAWEMEKYVDGIVEGVYWHRGRSPAYGEGISFWALGEMVRQRAHLAETDDEQTTRAGLAAAVADFIPDDEDRRWVERALLALLGVEPAPPGGRDVLFAAWRMFFEYVARRGTTILLFEDLQWGDAGLLDFVDHLLEWSRDVPLIVLALARPELRDLRPDFGAATRHFHSVPLEPLREEEMRQLLASLVPELPDAAVRRILQQADGIPLYAVETVRMLIVDGRLEPAGRGFRPVGELGELSIPDSLKSLVAARLDGLEPNERGLVQDASVLGQSFTLAALAAVNGEPVATLEQRLRDLVRREILDLQADRRSPERGQFSFVQSVIREVAYGTLSRRDRRHRHLAAARYHEALGEDELAGALANHYVAAYHASAAGEEAEAVAIQARLALRGAAERAISLGSPEQALAYLRQALEVTAEAAEQAGLLVLAAEAAGYCARADEGVELALQALDAYRSLGDAAGGGAAAGLVSELLIETGQLAEAAELVEKELPLVADLPNVRAQLLATLSRAQWRGDQAEQAIVTADRALRVAERAELEAVVAEAMVNKGSALGMIGRWREGTALLAGAIEIAERAGLIGLQLRAANNLASNLTNDDPLRAEGIARHALAQARRIGDLGHHWLAGTVASFAYYRGSDWESTIQMLDEVLGMRITPADRARMLSIRAAFMAPRHAGAAELVREVAELTKDMSDAAWQTSVHDIDGEEALATGDLERAHEKFMRSYSSFRGNLPYPVDQILRAALWAGRVDRARAAAQILEDLPASGRLPRASLVTARAGVAGLEGDHQQALNLYRDAFRRWRDLGLMYELARVQVDALTVLPDSAEIRAAVVEEARPLLERLGAARYLEIVDRALARTGLASAAPSATAPMEPSRPA